MAQNAQSPEEKDITEIVVKLEKVFGENDSIVDLKIHIKAMDKSRDLYLQGLRGSTTINDVIKDSRGFHKTVKQTLKLLTEFKQCHPNLVILDTSNDAKNPFDYAWWNALCNQCSSVVQTLKTTADTMTTIDANQYNISVALLEAVGTTERVEGLSKTFFSPIKMERM